MTLVLDMEAIEFSNTSSGLIVAHEPNEHLERNTLTISGVTEDDDNCEFRKVAEVQFLALYNYVQSDIHLFDVFDADSQLAYDAYNYVNGHQSIIEQAFSINLPIIMIGRIDIEEEFIGSEKETIEALSKFISKRFGDKHLVFGLAGEFVNYASDEAPLNKEAMLAALKENEYTMVETKGGYNSMPTFKLSSF